jgi:hypothetical protein
MGKWAPSGEHYCPEARDVRHDPDQCDECQHDPVEHPSHYTSHPSGVECIQITQHMNFCIGNAVKYLWRADLKWDAIEDLKKARWYIDQEIARREV